MNKKILAIVLTLNEEVHLSRCINSLKMVTDNIFVVDAYSTDSTLEIANINGARVLQHDWINYATQFNWALTQIGSDIEWVLRIDADEYLSDELIKELKNNLPLIGKDIDGIQWGRRMKFQGRLIRFGGIFPVQIVRMFRFGRGQCENRWMDEHIKVNGPILKLKGEMIDDNLKTLTWWTEKHNNYASREAVDLLNLEFNFMPHDSVADIFSGRQVGVKRWIKEAVYARMPGGTRAFLYYIYRYIFCFGFLDGAEGTAFHFFQGFWYRYLVDSKVKEVKVYMKNNSIDAKEAIKKVLNISI